MKASELMIGDYVTFKDSIECDNIPMKVKIVALGYQHRGEEDEALVQIDDDNACDIINIDNEVVGYPLTFEILEKNGFYYDEDRNAYLMGVIFQVKPERHGLFSFKICGCPYPLSAVHELQHALKLCGIDKEIVL